MKNISIIHTDFVNDICFDLYYTAYNIGLTNLNVTHEWLFNNLSQAIDIVKQDIIRINEDLIALTDDEEPTDLYDEMRSNERLLIKLSIITDLEGVGYAHPNHISNSISILSEKLTAQLDAKANEEATYNKHYCSSLAECLKELCEIIL